MSENTAFAQLRINPEWFDAIVPAPFGAVGLRLTAEKQSLFELLYLPDGAPEHVRGVPLAEKAAQQVKAYLKDARKGFDLPLDAQGTAFQNRVWQAISRIPVGTVHTYKQVGKSIECGSPRAVGGACGANPYPLIVPCHRVVAAGGIGGFARHDDAGFYIDVKRWLLKHEGLSY